MASSGIPKRISFFIFAISMLFFFSSCASDSYQPVIRKHPAPEPNLPQGSPQPMTFEALTRVQEISEEELLAAKQEAMANAAFTESAFATVPGRVVKAQFYNGWLYTLQYDESYDDEYGFYTYLTRTNGVVVEPVDITITNDQYYAYFFSISESGELVVLQTVRSTYYEGLDVINYVSTYTIDASGGVTQTGGPSGFYAQFMDLSPYYYNGFVYVLSPKDKMLYKWDLNAEGGYQPALPYEVYSFTGGADGKLYVYYKSEESASFGVFDLNVSETEPILQVPYNMTNIYGTSIVQFDPTDGSYYRATNNQFQTLDTETGKWDKVLSLGAETELQMTKLSGVKYEYSDFVTDENGDFHLAVSAKALDTGIYTTQVNQYKRK